MFYEGSSSLKEIKGTATLRELVDALLEFKSKHPELLDNEVNVASECGYSGAGIASPPIIAVNDETGNIRLVTTDDGYNTDLYTFHQHIRDNI